MAEGIEHVQFYSPPGSEEEDQPPVQADIETQNVVFPEQNQQEQETIPQKWILENKPEVPKKLSAEEERRQRREDLVHHRQEHLQRSMEHGWLDRWNRC